MLDDVPRQMQFLARRLRRDPAGDIKANLRELQGPPKELSSRIPSNQIPEVLLELEAGLGGDPFAAEPAYAVLASNMISVGVDVPRLGLMAVNGQPKSTAEYIQASSRVGRGLPGLVVTLYNFGRPRDVSHFEHFAVYHAALYRGVEATSVTPWAPRARDKALHAVVFGAIRHLVAGMLDDEDALNFDPTAPEVTRIVTAIAERADLGSGKLETADTRRELKDIVDRWARRSSRNRASRQRLRYWEKRAPFGKSAPYLMRAAEEARAPSVDPWTTPNSMREVEPSTAFIRKEIRGRAGSDRGDT
jgi:hypothetical protein